MDGEFSVAERLLIESVESVDRVRGFDPFDILDRVRCIQEVITLYERWNQREPSAEVQEKLKSWQMKLTDYSEIDYISTVLPVGPSN